MPRFFTYLLLLISVIFLSCQDDQQQEFDHWKLVDAKTTDLIFLNNISLGFQDLSTQNKSSSEFNAPRFNSALTELISHLNPQNSGFLILNGDNGSKDFYLVIKRADSIAQSQKPIVYAFDNDSIFRHEPGKYLVYSNKRELPDFDNELSPGVPAALVKLFDLKADKSVVMAKKMTGANESIFFDQDWVIYESQTNALGTAAHGVSLPKVEAVRPNGSVAKLLSLIQNQRPSLLHSDQIIPTKAQSSVSLAINNPEALSANLRQIDSSLTEVSFLESLQEFNLVGFGDEVILALKPIDLSSSLNAFFQDRNDQTIFRGNAINGVQGDSYTLEILDLMTDQRVKPNYAFSWDDYWIICPSLKSAQAYIQELQNKNVLNKGTNWSVAQSDMAKESNFLLWRKEEGSPSQVTQVIQDNGFAHFNYSALNAGVRVEQNARGPLMGSIRLKAPLGMAPQFFSNHKTGGKNIVVQDQSNRLYFISANGKTLWSRDLKEPILGKIQEVDLLRNGKKQLAFVTAHRLYIIDRKGRNVAPFPKKFKDEITQPLAVFDYENNRKYRFVVVQDRAVLMYNAQGKTVKGFTYKKAAARITHQPVHLRINAKDYLLFCLENGRLDILSRIGKIRVPVKEQFSFGSEPPTKKDGQFVLWTEDGSQIQIAPNGAVIKLTAKSPSEYRLVHYGPHTVEFDDPLLRIDQHLIELPLGRYLGPQVFKYGNKLRSVMIDQDTQNVYVYNSLGKLVSDDPLFGSSEVDIADLDKNKSLEMVVQGQADEVLIYSID